MFASPRAVGEGVYDGFLGYSGAQHLLCSSPIIKVFVRMTGQLSTAINPVVGSTSSVIVPCSLGASPSSESLPFLVSVFGVAFGFAGSHCGSGKYAGSV